MNYMKYRLGHKVQRGVFDRFGTKRIALGAFGGFAAIALSIGIIGGVPGVSGLGEHTAAAPQAGASTTVATSQKGKSTTGGKQTASSKKTTPMASDIKTSSAETGLRIASCTGHAPKVSGLDIAANAQLRKLAQYQQVCGGQLASRLSFFVPTPATVADARSYANDIVVTLRAYAQYGVAPLVFMEPATATGAHLDLAQYQNGAYDEALDAYFAAIKAAGITDSAMGMWVMLPEGNLPIWTSVDPSTFAASVTKAAQAQKKHFPGSKTSVMLDSKTYPSATSWSGGAYTSLVPYVQSIPKGLIDSFGLQGFPWSPPANEPGPSINDPKAYLQIDLAAAAARSLGVTNIWLNTGTFSRQHTNNAAQTVTATPIARQALLDGVTSQAKSLNGQGFAVSVHLFAQDKTATGEAIDWSYWHAPGDSPSTDVFATFAHDLTAANVPLWIFDTY